MKWKKLLRRGLLDGGVEAGLLAGGGVLLEDALRDGLVDGFLSLLERFLGGIDLVGGNRLASGLDGAFEHSLHDLVAFRLVCGHTHVLFGVLLDRHNDVFDDEKTTRLRSTLLYHGGRILASPVGRERLGK